MAARESNEAYRWIGRLGKCGPWLNISRHAVAVILLGIITTPSAFSQSPSGGYGPGTGNGSSSPSPGVFNSNFDPPLFQNYSLATTGAQAAINLTANPIDTHTITWRPSGTVSTCTVALDTSADGVSWTAGGAIAGQTCTSAGSFTSANLSANFVRVNLTTLTGGGTLTVVYSGRLAPAAAVGGTASVSNGQWVQAGEIIWVQDTTQSNLGTMSLHSSARILQPNGTVTTNAWDTSCNSGITSGVGTGFTVAASGWLQSLTTYVVSAGIPQGAVYTNLYILNSMPSGGNQATCVGTLTTTNIGILLAGTPTGSFYPVSFVGTTSLIQSPYSIPGFTAENIIANPAAGAEISKNFGAGNSARTCIQGLSFQLVTSATVANRTVSVRINTGTTPVQMFYVAGTVQAASATVLYSFAPGTTASQTALGALNVQTVPFNNGQMFCVSPGTALSISTVTNNLQAGDQYSNIDVMTQVQQDNN